MSNLTDMYFDWLCQMVTPKKHVVSMHSMLLSFLHSTEFIYILPMDANRYEDGVDLRYRFGHDYEINPRDIARVLDREPCSVLEMMVALSLRCEEHIMDDPDAGDRTGRWFWEMIKNLGLSDQTNDKFDSRYVGEIIENFLNRNYEPDGRGSLFHLSRESMRRWTNDIRTVEIWYQAMWYFSDFRD